MVLVDCGGDVLQRAMAAALPLDELTALILTHEHADHVSGFPLFMEKLWLAGRRKPIPVHGPRSALAQAKRLFESFDTSGWEGLPTIEWHEVALKQGSVVLDDANWRITAAPGVHGVPVIGVRIEEQESGGVVAYSCDTERCESIAHLSSNANVLVHEATGDFPGHSTADDAASIAAAAGAGRLLLVHLPSVSLLGDSAMARAHRIFPQTEKGDELGTYSF